MNEKFIYFVIQQRTLHLKKRQQQASVIYINFWCTSKLYNFTKFGIISGIISEVMYKRHSRIH